MTIVTKPLTDEKKDLKPLVIDAKSGEDGMFMDSRDRVSTVSEIGVYQHPIRKHRTGFLVCLGLLLILTVGCATMGSIYLYYRYSRPEGYHGSCMIRFNNNQPRAGNYISPFEQPPLDGAPFQSHSSALAPTSSDDSTVRQLKPRNRMVFPEPDGSADSREDDMQRIFSAFQQQFELDLQKQLWEVLQIPRVPSLGLGRPARFIHDFNLNLTAILDMQSKDCYIMPLNRSVVKPPQDLFEFLRGLEDGTYTVDGSAIRQNYVANPIPFTDLTSLGPFIAGECANSAIYTLLKLDNADGDRVRRDVAASGAAVDHVVFGEFAGKSLHTVNIIKKQN